MNMNNWDFDDEPIKESKPEVDLYLTEFDPWTKCYTFSEEFLRRVKDPEYNPSSDFGFFMQNATKDEEENPNGQPMILMIASGHLSGDVSSFIEEKKTDKEFYYEIAKECKYLVIKNTPPECMRNWNNLSIGLPMGEQQKFTYISTHNIDAALISVDEQELLMAAL
jgi:hypothetical protein